MSTPTPYLTPTLPFSNQVVFGTVNVTPITAENITMEAYGSYYIAEYVIYGHLLYAANNTGVGNAAVTLTMYNDSYETTLTQITSSNYTVPLSYGDYYFEVDPSYAHSTAVLSANGTIVLPLDLPWRYYPIDEYNQFPPCNVIFNVYPDSTG